MKYEAKEQALAALEALNGKHRMEVCFFFRFFKYLLIFYGLSYLYDQLWHQGEHNLTQKKQLYNDAIENALK